jgi:hypothetical protein
MDQHTNQGDPVPENGPRNGPPGPELLTVSQAYDYLISEGLPRSKKTIRKWCRHNHVEWKEFAVPGGAKWLITRSSLEARVSEERLIDASLTKETAATRFEPVRPDTSADPSGPARNDALVTLLREQLTHERKARTTAEEKNRELIDNYHEISLASAQMGIEIGKGLQIQASTRRLTGRSKSDVARSVDIATGSRVLDGANPPNLPSDAPTNPDDDDRDRG